MRVYLAGPWKQKERVKAWARGFEERGHTITHKWWDYDVPDLNPDEMRVCALADISAVNNADCLVIYDGKVSEGKATELGLALAWGMSIIILHCEKEGTPYHNIFHYLPHVVHCYHPDEVWELLLELRDARDGRD